MENRVALVTGSGKGIGRGIALKLAEAGFDVAVHYGSSHEGAEEIAARIEAMGRKALVLQADIQRVEAIRAMFADFSRVFSRLDVLVNNAGITKMEPFLEAKEETWDQVTHTDLKGSFFCAQEAARRMVEQQIRGVIVNISSNHAIGCWPNATIYGPAKAALDKLTKNMALDLAPHGIRVVAIAPGYTELEWFTENRRPYVEQTSRKIPLQRFAHPDEIGQAVVYLASESAGYITGTTLYMDGGALLPVVPHNNYT